MRIVFLEVARIEFDEAIEFYNYESPGLGNQFLNEAVKALTLIAEHPEAWQVCSKRTRRFIIRKFPYGIIYQARKDEILVVAIANLHRKPEYWKDRIG